jgi:peptidoglycan/LPS O-acetylase OafA/YrhL
MTVATMSKSERHEANAHLSGPQSSPVRFVASWASIHFDLLRAMAAFFVLLEHWRNFLFTDFLQLTSHRGLLAPLYLLTSAGHQAVVVFFVLSGYFIGGTVLRALERDQWVWGGYLLRRTVRLWVVLVPALLLSLFWDRLGIHLGHAPALYHGHGSSNQLGNVAAALTPRIFFGNLFFLQTILTPTFGSNGALWSLANEFWYYLLFPLGLIALWRTQRPARRLICAILFLAIVWFVPRSLLVGFPIWLAGVVLFKVPQPSFTPRLGRYLRVAAAALYLPLFLAVGKLTFLTTNNRDYLLTLITVVFLWILLSAKEPYTPEALRVRAARELARFSYTLYAVHVPFLVFVAAWVVGVARWYPGASNLIAASGILLIVFLYSWAIGFLTEFRTDAVRAKLEKLFRITPVRHLLPTNPLSDPPTLSTPSSNQRA